MNTDVIRDFTLWARGVLTGEVEQLLNQVYGLRRDGTWVEVERLAALCSLPEAMETRRRMEKWMADEADAGVQPPAAVAKLVKETAFTHLNRLVSFKMLEHPERRVIRRAALEGYPEPNGFRMWVVENDEVYRLYELGSTPLDGLGEGPKDRAYRHFLLWQCSELAKEVRVLFDPDNLPGRLFPRPMTLRPVIDRLNSEDLKEAWAVGNEETIGWIYQFFIADEKAEAFRKVFKEKKKFLKEDVPAATQVFTPRWIVKFLVENSLGRLWLSMHPTTRLADEMRYLVPMAKSAAPEAPRSVREIRLLDPATGTMHFGLVAFDLLVRMYREEMDHAGTPGWPETPPVRSVEEIPASILKHNLFGIDLDLRAVQLAALALYVRAKSLPGNVQLTDSNLASADVAILRGSHRERIAAEMSAQQGLNRQLIEQFCDLLGEASQMGSLVRVERILEGKLWGDELRQAIERYAHRKAVEGVDESFFVGEAAKGIRLLDVLGRRYDVVFTNPPYMSNRNMNGEMSQFLKQQYSDSKGDLYSAFIERCAELLVPGGRIAMITQQSFMYISSYLALRKNLLDSSAIECMAHLGPRAFEEVTGEKVNTAAFVLRREGVGERRRESQGVYVRLVKAPDAEAKRLGLEQALERRRRGEPDPRVYTYRQGDFAAIPGSPWVYWIAEGIRKLFASLPNLGDLARPRHGLSTCNNFRYLRQWWELGHSSVTFGCAGSEDSMRSGGKWFPYMKGGSFQRWIGNQSHVVNWRDNGDEIKADIVQRFPYLNGNWGLVVTNPDFYFRRGVTWTDLTAGRFSARLSPGGFIFDVSGSSVFPPDVELVLGVMNSSFAQYALKLINPTVHVQVGDLARLPIPNQSSGPLRGMVEQAVELARADSREDETTYDFVAPPDWLEGADAVARRHRELAGLERAIDDEVYRLYAISDPDRQAIEAELAAPAADTDPDGPDSSDPEDEAPAQAPLTPAELAAQWLRYAVGVALGRFQPGVPGALGRGRWDPELAARLRQFADPDGIMVLGFGHPDDLVQRVLDILHALHGDAECERLVRAAVGAGDMLWNGLATWLAGEFFRDHVRRYRKRPIYWLLQSPKKTYNLFLFHEKATADTLALIRSNRYLGGRLNSLRQQQSALNESATGYLKPSNRRLASLVAELLAELEEFDRLLEAATRVPARDRDGRDVTVRWVPEPDDGVYLNCAPLHALLPAWREVNPKKAWQELADGKYDWSKTAMRYWPQRVLAKCRENRSFAIAHGLE